MQVFQYCILVSPPTQLYECLVYHSKLDGPFKNFKGKIFPSFDVWQDFETRIFNRAYFRGNFNLIHLAYSVQDNLTGSINCINLTDNDTCLGFQIWYPHFHEQSCSFVLHFLQDCKYQSSPTLIIYKRLTSSERSTLH